jgi:hypothetical protein
MREGNHEEYFKWVDSLKDGDFVDAVKEERFKYAA